MWAFRLCFSLQSLLLCWRFASRWWWWEWRYFWCCWWFRWLWALPEWCSCWRCLQSGRSLGSFGWLVLQCSEQSVLQWLLRARWCTCWFFCCRCWRRVWVADLWFRWMRFLDTPNFICFLYWCADSLFPDWSPFNGSSLLASGVESVRSFHLIL